jgi:hypothetical protein
MLAETAAGEFTTPAAASAPAVAAAAAAPEATSAAVSTRTGNKKRGRSALMAGVRCDCKGKCSNSLCRCKKANVRCSPQCHNGGRARCKNQCDDDDSYQDAGEHPAAGRKRKEGPSGSDDVAVVRSRKPRVLQAAPVAANEHSYGQVQPVHAHTVHNASGAMWPPLPLPVQLPMGSTATAGRCAA